MFQFQMNTPGIKRCTGYLSFRKFSSWSMTCIKYGTDWNRCDSAGGAAQSADSWGTPLIMTRVHSEAQPIKSSTLFNSWLMTWLWGRLPVTVETCQGYVNNSTRLWRSHKCLQWCRLFSAYYCFGLVSQCNRSVTAVIQCHSGRQKDTVIALWNTKVLLL